MAVMLLFCTLHSYSRQHTFGRQPAIGEKQLRTAFQLHAPEKLLFTDDGDGLARQHRQVELHLALGEQRGPIRRSEERRVGKECGSTCRSRGSPEHKKKKK